MKPLTVTHSPKILDLSFQHDTANPPVQPQTVVLASVYELLPRTCLEAASDGCPAGQRLYSLNPGFAVAIQIKEAEERLLRGVHFRESRLEAGPSW